MIVDRNDRRGVEEDGWLENFTWVHKAESECPNRDDIHTDAGVLGIETADEELLAIKTSEAGAQRLGCGSGFTKKTTGSGMTSLGHECDPVARNELWNGKSVDELFGHVRPMACRALIV